MAVHQDIALMDEQEREGFIKKIGISAGNSDETDEDEEEDDPEHHKYNCKKCQVSFVQISCDVQQLRAKRDKTCLF